VSTKRLSDVHEKLGNEVGKFEEYAKELHLGTERVLAKYKKDIIHQGFILNRLADMAIDLFGMAAVISRVDGLLKDKGESGASRELLLCQTYCEEAWRRIRRNSRQIDNNIDSWRKEIATNTYETNGYAFNLIG